MMMKNFYLCAVILFGCTALQAQYKKASFLNKEGRTYELGTMGRFLGNGAGVFNGIYLSVGQDKGTKLFVSFDLELIMAKKFSYKTVDINNPNTNVTVFSKSGTALTYRYNVAYYLTNAENSTSKFKPFVAVGANFIMALNEPKILETNPANSNPQKIVEFNSLSFGGNAGIGCVYALTENLGIKVIAGYNYQSTNNKSDVESNLKYGQTLSQLYTSHPYVGVGLRYAIGAE